MLATLDPATLPARMVYVGGEAVPQSLKDSWAPFRRFQNLYGPTETTVAVTISKPLSVGAPVVLGDAFTGTGLMVLDARLRPSPWVRSATCTSPVMGWPAATCAARRSP